MKQSLIDKDKLVESMVWRDNQGMILSIDDVLDTIENAPTIDPESLRPTAHWVKDGDAENLYRGSGMNIAEYAEYITGKADECRARLEAKP